MVASASIALGSNLGDRGASIDAATRALRETPGIESLRASRLYETPPVGGPPGQGPFLNGAAAIETSLDPMALRDRLIQIEQELGRVRIERWGERAIDLDLLLFDDLVLDSPELTIPHPRMALRRFVLVPLAEVAPDAVDPLTGKDVRSLLANLDRRPGCVVLRGPDAGNRRVFDRLVATLPSVGWMDFTKGGESLEELADFLSDSLFDDVLKVKARHLDFGEWSETLADGRWLVTDLDFSAIYAIGSNPGGFPFRDDPEESRGGAIPRRERFLKAREGIVPPTFLAATDAADYGHGRRFRDAQADPIFRETPLLWPGLGDPWPGYEASREAIEAGMPLPVPSDEEVDRIVSGIIAACQASRAETRVVAS